VWIPLHQVARIDLPERKIRRVPFLVVDLHAGAGAQIIERLATQLAVVGEALDIVVDLARALGDVGMTAVEQLLDLHQHVADVIGGARVVVSVLNVERLAIGVELVLEMPCYPVRIPAEVPRLFLQLVLARAIGSLIFRQMPDVRDVHDLPHLVTAPLEVAAQEVGEQERSEVSDVARAVDGGPAVVHRDHAFPARLERNERLLAGIVQGEGHG
jgi:hypothetical protein